MTYLYVAYVLCLFINLAVVGYFLYRDRHTDISLNTLLSILFIVVLSHVPIVNFIVLIVGMCILYSESGIGNRTVIKGRPR